jgi:histidyl-tRNA synthetase
MASIKPSVPKGTRDFSPTEMVRRNFIFDTIKSVFRKYGYQQIETPSMENLSTLTGKYGDEGDKLIFKVLNSGEKLWDAEIFRQGDKFNLIKHQKEKTYNWNDHIIKSLNKERSEITESISEKALRYDLTVPFARYVVMHQNEITFPFKRFQVQPVWRAVLPVRCRCGRLRFFTERSRVCFDL